MVVVTIYYSCVLTLERSLVEIQGLRLRVIKGFFCMNCVLCRAVDNQDKLANFQCCLVTGDTSLRYPEIRRVHPLLLFDIAILVPSSIQYDKDFNILLFHHIVNCCIFDVLLGYNHMEVIYGHWLHLTTWRSFFADNGS